MTIPAFATIAYTVPLGKQSFSQVANTISQDIGASGNAETLPFGAGPLQYMQWPAAIHDVTALSLDGLTVRRLITFPTPPAIQGQFPYANAEALKSCLRNLYTRQLEAFCGTAVTALEPVVFDNPITILGLSLDSWWHAGAVGSAVSVFTPASWPSDGLIGFGRTFLQGGGAALELVATTSDQFAGRAVAESTLATKFMQTVAAGAVAQPFSVAMICSNTADGAMLDALVASKCRFTRANPIVAFTTDPVGLNAQCPPDGVAALVGGDGASVDGTIRVDGGVFGPGDVGVGTPTGLTLANDVTLANGALGLYADVILGASGARFTDAQWSALYDYARGWYGVDLW